MVGYVRGPCLCLGHAEGAYSNPHLPLTGTRPPLIEEHLQRRRAPAHDILPLPPAGVDRGENLPVSGRHNCLPGKYIEWSGCYSTMELTLSYTPGMNSQPSDDSALVRPA